MTELMSLNDSHSETRQDKVGLNHFIGEIRLPHDVKTEKFDKDR